MKYIKLYENFNLIIDSEMSLEEAISGVEIPSEIKDTLCITTVKYYGFDDKIHQGQIVVHKKLEKDIKRIFEELLSIKFPINSVIPISKFGWSDYESVKANNSSCFNYRVVAGSTNLSEHAKGCAIDINPFQNPWVHPSAHKIEGREYNLKNKGTIDGYIVEIFKQYGWNWGGNWRNPDYQHFFKPVVSFISKVKKFFKK